MARNIQINFLPKSNPDVQGYDIAGKSLPAMNVGFSEGNPPRLLSARGIALGLTGDATYNAQIILIRPGEL